MSLRAWSGRRIGYLWLAGLAFYGALAILDQVQARRNESRFRVQYGIPRGTIAPGPDTQSAASRDSSLALLSALLRATSQGTPAHRDSVLQQLSAIMHDTIPATKKRDSLYHALSVSASLEPTQRDSLRVATESLLGRVFQPAVRGIGTAVQGLAPWLYLAIALYLAPVAALVITTIAWALARRRDAASSTAPAA